MKKLSWKQGLMAGSAMAASLLGAPAYAQSAATEGQNVARPADTANADDADIVVTANRRTETLSTVPAEIQAFSGAKLDARGASGFQDYLLQVPGASFRDQGNGATRIALRGVSNLIGSDYGTTSTVSTVGLYINDIPIQGTSVLPDLAPYDLDRVEVLKGPQGTLYGEGAMGGAVRLILRSPDPTRAEGKADGTFALTDGGAPSYGLRGMVNLPVGKSAALRIVGSYRNDGGYIDDVKPATASSNVNDMRTYAIRGNFLANVSNDFTVEALAMLNVQNLDAPNQITEALSGFRVNKADAFQPEYNRARVEVYGLTLKYQLPFAELTSVTSYYRSNREFVSLYPLASLFVPVVADNSVLSHVDLKSAAQEFRLVSKSDGAFKWVLGGFYRDKRTNQYFDQNLRSADFVAANAYLTARAQAPFTFPTVYHETGRETFSQYAAYAEGTLTLAGRLDFTAGLRWYDESRTYDPSTTASGPLAAFASDPAARKVKDNGVVPKFSLAYRFADDRLIYATASKGFRTSVINIQYRPDGLGLGNPEAGSDSLWNYEIGAKTRWLDGRLTLNATGYYINWSNIQLPLVGISPLTGASAGYVGNGGTAEIWGFTLEAAAQVTPELSIGGNAGYLHTEITSGAAVGVIEGQRLPNSPQWTLNGQLQYRKPVANLGSIYAQFNVSYVDGQTTRILTTREANPRDIPSYTLGDFRLGLDMDNGLGISLFVNNLWNERAILGRGSVAASLRNPDLVGVGRPRTIGAMLSTRF